eukprot:jgi/Chrzof1/722/Cz01g26100.t1
MPPAVAAWEQPTPRKAPASKHSNGVNMEPSQPAAVVVAAAAAAMARQSSVHDLQSHQGAVAASQGARGCDNGLSSNGSGHKHATQSIPTAGRASPATMPGAAGPAASGVGGLTPAVVQPGGSASLLSACPPCEVPVSVTCFGGHGSVQQPCHRAAPFCCGQPCGRQLACGNHTCQNLCHVTHATASEATACDAPPEPCEVCSAPCSKPRSCGHPCPAPCHQGPCEPCTQPVTHACHCGKTTLTFPCHVAQQIASATSSGNSKQQQRQQQKGVPSKQLGSDDRLCCGKICHRQLPHCPHSCRSVCHQGPCAAGDHCAEEVTLRCSCRKQKQKWPCWRVQQAIKASSKHVDYDGVSAVKLLPCDAGCSAVKKGAGSDKAAQNSHSTAQTHHDGTVGSNAGQGASSMASKFDDDRQLLLSSSDKAASKKLTRAERQALAEQREAERAKQARRQQLKRWSMYLAVLLLVVALGAGVGIGCYWLLSKVDQTAQSVWRPDADSDL